MPAKTYADRVRQVDRGIVARELRHSRAFVREYNSEYDQGRIAGLRLAARCLRSPNIPSRMQIRWDLQEGTSE